MRIEADADEVGETHAQPAAAQQRRARRFDLALGALSASSTGVAGWTARNRASATSSASPAASRSSSRARPAPSPCCSSAARSLRRADWYAGWVVAHQRPADRRSGGPRADRRPCRAPRWRACRRALLRLVRADRRLFRCRLQRAMKQLRVRRDLNAVAAAFGRRRRACPVRLSASVRSVPSVRSVSGRLIAFMVNLHGGRWLSVVGHWCAPNAPQDQSANQPSFRSRSSLPTAASTGSATIGCPSGASHLEVQVGARGPTASARAADRLPRRHLVACLDRGGRQMGVPRSAAVGVLDHDGRAVAALLAAEHHPAGGGGLNVLAVGGAQVDALVKLRLRR